MKTKNFSVLAFCIAMMIFTSSCLVVETRDPGKRGWHKNTNNPHNPNTTNPGKAKGHHKK